MASIRVTDFDQFLSVFTTSGADLRRTYGSRGARLFRNTEDPAALTILFDWDPDGFRRFVAAAEGQAVMREAGVQGPPEAVFLEHATDTSG
jgi:hypothetical protein